MSSRAVRGLAVRGLAEQLRATATAAAAAAAAAENEKEREEAAELESVEDDDLACLQDDFAATGPGRLLLHESSPRPSSAPVSFVGRAPLKTRRVKVTGLPATTREREVLRLFSVCGAIRDVKLSSSGSCFVLFSRSREALAACHRMNGQRVGDDFLTVELEARRHSGSSLRHSQSQDDMTATDSVSTLSGVSGNTSATLDEAETFKRSLRLSVLNDLPMPLPSPGESIYSLSHLFEQAGDVETGKFSSKIPPRPSRADDDRDVLKRVVDSLNSDPIERRCEFCPRAWSGSIQLFFSCCYLCPCFLYLFVQTGLIYVLLYPVCIAECIFWSVYHFFTFLMFSLTLCLADESEGGLTGASLFLVQQSWEILAYVALLVTMAVPILPMLLATQTSEGDWESEPIPTIIGPLSPLRLTLLTATLGEEKNYQRVSARREGFKFFRW